MQNLTRLHAQFPLAVGERVTELPARIASFVHLRQLSLQVSSSRAFHRLVDKVPRLTHLALFHVDESNLVRIVGAMLELRVLRLRQAWITERGLVALARSDTRLPCLRRVEIDEFPDSSDLFKFGSRLPFVVTTQGIDRDQMGSTFDGDNVF